MGNGNSPLISVIIPAYNVEEYIGQCLESVMGQTYANIEIICVHDGGTDSTVKIIKDYAKQDSRIILIDKENGGVSAARNDGLRAAKGEYILFVDGDDWIDSDTCEVCLNTATKHCCDAVLFSYVREFQSSSMPKSIFNKNEIVFDEQACRELNRRMIGPMGDELKSPEKLDSLSTVWGVLYRSEIIKRTGVSFVDLKRIGTCEDGLFNIEVFAKVKKAVYIDKYFYHYRKFNTSSITSKHKPELMKQWLCLFGEMERVIKENELGAAAETALSNRIALSIIGLGLNCLSQNAGSKIKIQNIRAILKSSVYSKAIKQLLLRYFPPHWFVFFICAKLKFAIGVYLLLCVIKKIIKK